MKICLVSSGWIPIVPSKGVLYGGGIEAQVYGLAKALTKLCDEVHLVTVRSDSHCDQDAEGIIYHGIALPSSMPALESMLTLAYSDLMFAYKSKRIQERLDIDLVHCNTKLPAAATLLKRSKRPLVFTAHNWKLWEGIKPEWKNSFARTAFELDAKLERRIAVKSDRISAISNAMKKGIVGSTGISEKKVEVVPNAVNTEVFYREPVNKIRSILYVGRITAEKGIDTLVKAMPKVLKEAADTKLIIVGPKKYGFERGGYEEQLRQLIKKLRIEQNVVFLGAIPLNDLRKMYSQASVFCLPSVWQEPFGLALIEAMACETAVIGTRVGGIPEAISEGKDGLLVNPNSVEELVKAIIRILSDDRFAQNLGKNGRKKVLEKYTFDRQAERAYSSYASLLA